MSTIPTSVSIISCIEEDYIHGCTVSSLVSLDVSNDSAKIACMLKEDSSIGQKIIKNKIFSINVLSAGQDNLAKRYSNFRNPDLLVENKWEVTDNKFAHIKNRKLSIDCELFEVIEKYPAYIFIGKVVDYTIENHLSTLIYESRQYINLDFRG